MSTTTSHAELIGHSTTQQPSAATVDGGPNIIIMENNIINCGGEPNKYIITSQPSSQQQQQTQPQHIILSNSGGVPKKSGKIAASQNNRHKSQSLVVSSKSGPPHQMIMTTNTAPMVPQSPKEPQRMYTVQQKTPKTTMYTTQQVYATNVVSSSSQQQQQKMQPRNVQVVSKNANNMILCRSPSNNHTEHAQFIQQIHESNQQPAFASTANNATTTTTTMKTIYVNNNTGGLNLNKSSNNNKILTPIDYSAVVEQQQKQQQGNIAKYVTQKIVQNSNSTATSSSNAGPELIDASAASSSSTTSKKNFPNNCTISVPTTTQYYYQPATVYTTDPNKVSSSTTTTTKIIGNAKNVQQQQQQQPQYIQIQNHRLTGNNANYVTTTSNPAPIQKHRNSTSSSKYIIQNVQSNAIPVSSVTQQQQQQSQSIRQTTPTVISYSNSSTTTNSNDQQQQPSVIQSPLKMRTVLHPIESGIEDGARIYTVHHGSTSNEAPADEVDSAARNNDQNYMMVNGTKMTDEMSARILHDLSQRSSIKYNSGKSNHTGGPSASNGDIVQLSQGSANVYATRQPDGTVIWNGTPQTPTSQETQYVRRTSESSNYVPQEYQRQSSNSISGSDSHIIYQSSGIIVDRAQAEQDEEVIGIEVRPSPIPITPDGKLSVLHAVYQDHTYCTPTTTRLVSMAEQTFSTMNPNLDTNTVAAAAVLSSMPGAAKLFNRQSSGVVTSVPCVQQQQSHQLMIPMQQQPRDDDANSTISTESHGGLYIDQGEDPGEETETALEGEGEEDSETRCICELTHDDGYMICCDSCSTWQHVDCMKIDRQNIPEEYQCVNCFPREVDVLAARTLQLQKRKEQSALQLYPMASIYEGAQNKMQPGAGGKNDKKNNLSLKQQKKKDLLSGKKTKKDLKDPKHSKRNDSANRSNGKRKDPKRLSKKKLKQLSGDPSSHSTPDKLTSTLRNWIDNYEVAMTNHYSPELRARLQSYGKNMNPADLANLPPEPKIQWMDVDQPICTTVPHAGAKILISTRNIDPNAAIIEIRGKYMLDTQQNKSNNAMLNATRKPSSGPFLFYHSIPRGNLDICVDTRTYGNEARFIRRSCRPNAEIQHKMEKNSVHLYIVARYKIMEGAEITIAHDVNVDPLTRTNSMSHTSTLCACGLVRDCKFAAALAATPPLSSPPHHSAPPLFTQNVIKRKNGVHVGPDGVKEKRKYKKRKEKPPKDQKENRSRGRSTSSSTDSHAGMLSPPLKNYDMHPDFIRSQMIPQSHLQILPNHITEPLVDGVRSITPVMQQHHEVFYESAGLLKQQLDAPHHEPSIDVHHVHQHQHILPKSPPAIISDVIQVVKEVPVHVPEPRAITPVQLAPIVTTPQQQQATILHSPVPQLVNNVVPVQQNNANKPEIIQKSPPTTPQKPQKRSSKSQRNSMHENTNSVKEEASSSTVPNTPTKDDAGHNDKSAATSHEKKKLTREERKLEAYIKAFEKIEKKEQRKQEQKTHKITPKKNRSLNSSSSSAQKNSMMSANKRRMMNQKRKKRKSKSQSGKKGDHHSDSSDASSCDEKITKPAVSALNFNSSYNNSRSAMSSAELLLSYSKLKNEAPTNLSGIPPLISPACMLVEAAVGDLEPANAVESSFKFPHKTKTKKGMMNEWLNNSENDLELSVPNNIRYGDEEPLSLVKNEYDVKCLKSLTTPPQASSPQAESCSFAGSESAVKKRWLRQAISEETNDESGNSQQNEFTTPLKKRRVVIEQQAEEASPSSSNDVSASTKIEKDEASQESLSEHVKEEEVEENSVKKEEQETKSNLLTLEDVKVEDSVDESLKKEEISVETLTNSIKVEEPEDEKSSNSDEMAHLHKVVASFHSESLLMLQSRNKKTSGTASLPETPKKESKQGSPVMSDENASKSVSPDTTMQEPTSTVESPDAKNVVSSTSILAQTLSGNAPTTPVAETIPFGSSRYLNNIQRSEVPSILATAPPVIEEYTPTADYRTSFTYRPMMTNLTMSEYGNESHPQDPYIPSYNKATLIAATTPTGATLTGQFAPAFSSTYASGTNDVSGSNTAFLGKSYSTLNDTATGPAYYGQKIFTKTASHDPRLNPSLVTTPEEVKPAQPPQPKKKLSLTEYRKRKAQSTDSASNDGENSSGVNNISTTDDLNTSKVDEDFPNKKKFTPNASPTRNSLDEDTTRSGNVTPTPCNNIDDTTENDNLPSSSTSGNNSPTRSADDELTEKVASKMTSNANDTGNSPTQTTENEEEVTVAVAEPISAETNNDNAVTQDVDEDKK
ncbi:uncharacterized protein LOC134838240 isoform X2 [Culicoides brevitarsis]|uniref:uncharacterized protein LOC134838240 isoform X2 n=1 Tax=Culicoides brevitarsis TaxID=469753 RepID=UPI00307B5166